MALISLLDVVRDPRWGRSEECFSEDPYLCSKMAEQVVKAVQDEGVSVVAKHLPHRVNVPEDQCKCSKNRRERTSGNPSSGNESLC